MIHPPHVPTLSILIPSIPKRAHLLLPLLRNLYQQAFNAQANHPGIGFAEILVDDSPGYLDGGLSIGKKREALVRRAQGRYCCFLDDDDRPSPDYVEMLLRLCGKNVHVVTFRALVMEQSYWGLVNMSLHNKANEQLTPEGIVQRPPWHMCPVWTEFARLYPFADKNNAEDYEWMEKVLGHCQTEAHTDRMLFLYQHGAGSEADLITRLENSL